MEPSSRDHIRYNPPPPRMTAMEATTEDSGRDSSVGLDEKFKISRERMRELFACANDICTVLDEYGVAPVEGCYVRKFVEELWRLK